MTVQEITDIANKHSEKRGADILDLTAELLLAVQDVCMESHWWWRRKTFIFPTEIGTWEYDLTEDGIDADDLLQFVKDGVKIFTSTTDYTILEPEFDEDQQDVYLNAAQMGNSGTPGKYFMKPGAWNTMVVTPTPDAVLNICASHWPVPQDPLENDIPLIPPALHGLLLVPKLEARIFRATLGEGSAKYLAAESEYQKGLSKASLYANFAEGRVKQVYPPTEDAIRST